VEFLWTNDNVEHIAKHGIRPHEAEYIVETARAPFPRMVGGEKRKVVGQLADGRYVQVIYVPSRSIPGVVYVIHSRILSDAEKRRFRRRIR